VTSWLRAPTASGSGRGGGNETGAVAAEFAVALPAVVLVLLLAAGALGACATQVRLQDAAADAARLAGRGETDGRSATVVADAGGSASIDRRGELVCVTATAPISMTWLTLGDVSATSCALAGGR